MRGLQYIWLFIISITAQVVLGQNKTDIPSTYGEVCFFTIKKVEFENFLKVKKGIEREEYGVIYTAIRKMRTSLKGFSVRANNRSFELWYVGNYTDFGQQAMVAKESTLSALRSYESRLRTRDVIYYDHRLFLEQYLAFETEAFYSEYWFMSQERYFSRDAVNRIVMMNKEEGQKLFANSEFYRPFDIFNDMAASEEEEIKDYLDLEEAMTDSTVFIPYSYMILDKTVATYILEVFNLDDATQNIDLDREVRALKRFLINVKSDKIHFVARFNHLELKRMKELEAQKERPDR